MSRFRKSVFVALAAVGVLAIWAVVYNRTTYPYGASHCCIIGINMALLNYAEEHGGKFPAGEASPEASLSLLNGPNYIDPSEGPNLLRGMIISEKIARRALEKDGHLGPDSCGWHYEPGLTRADNPKLALLWCKSALGHNGQRMKDGGREVVFVGSGIGWVSGDKWPAFLQEQKTLLEHRSAQAISGVPLLTGIVELPDGRRVDRVEENYTLSETSKSSAGTGSGTSSGTGLNSSLFVCYRAPLQNGSMTRTLSFSDLVSDPVTVTFTEGVPDLTEVVFKMHKKQ
jgi:hypothetical protein